MKILFEFLPIILFFAAFKMKGIYFATAVAIAASILQIIVSYASMRKVEKMMWISLAVILIFGGTTLLLHNEVFIKWKPTILYWIFAAVIASAQIGFKKNIIRSMIEKQVLLPDLIWSRLNAVWCIFFTFLGGLNLFVAYNYSTDTWVNFKLFGIMGFMLIFIIAQSLIISPFIKEDKKA